MGRGKQKGLKEKEKEFRGLRQALSQKKRSGINDY